MGVLEYRATVVLPDNTRDTIFIRAHTLTDCYASLGHIIAHKFGPDTDPFYVEIEQYNCEENYVYSALSPRPPVLND